MSKSRGNAIELRAGADETARLFRRAVTDSERRVTYEPERRPEVSNLVLLAALARDEDPEVVAEGVGSRGTAALKDLVTEAVNERLADLRRPRAELVADEGALRDVLARGTEKARAVARETLGEVRSAMSMHY